MEDTNADSKQTLEPETSRRTFLKTSAATVGTALIGTVLTSTTGFAKDIENDKENDEGKINPDEVELLFVQSAENVVGQKDKFTMKGINPQTIFFSDRPKRIAGHMDTKEFVEDWQAGKGKNSFVENPPNATLSIFGKDEIVDIVMTLKNPHLEGDELTYDIAVLLKDQLPVSGPCSLFIDPVGRPMSPGSVAGVHRRRRRRAVRHAVVM